MEKEILQIKNYIDGVNDELFFDADNPVTITAYEYTANRMGSVTLSASFMYPKMLDDYWDGTQYVEFQGEKYYVNQVPTSSKDNTDERYKYEVDFVSERKVLESVYFFDVVTDESEQDKYQSNSSKVIFYGDINEFAKRLNYSLKYSNLDYTVVVDEGVTSAERQVSFEDKFMYDALQEIYNTYNVPFYFDGKTIHIGYTNNAIAIPFAYGFDRELLSITKTNANYKIVNRCTGTGSSDNIPYYYPNPSDDREAVGDAWITPSTTLMPPIYRQSGGAERFYNAVNDTYPRPDGGYYTFENEYKGNNPKEQIVKFEDIKPTIVEVTNANGDRIDMIAEFAYDSDDNDDVDAETGDYLHPYFYARLRKMDGEWGFNLFEHAITANTPMTISMTSGNCASCNFEIGVVETVVDGKEVFQNPVQVDGSGNIVAGSYADKVKPDNIQPQQQDTSTNSVWIALKKDINTFGTIMPSVNNNYKPSSGDTFVILYIELPQAYIDAAEKKLEGNIIAYMLDNNSTKFNFSINFSQVYFAENPDTLALMNENARLIIEYNNKEYTLYISSYSYKVTDDSPLPTITVDLADTLTIRKGFADTIIDSVKGDITISGGSGGSGSGGSGDIVADGNKYFLRKDIDDNARGAITFERYIGSRSYREGKDGIGWRIENNGTANFNSVNTRTDLLVGRRIGSWEFVSGFPNGIGWDLSPYKKINAAQIEETKYRLEIDDIIVRGKLRVFEMVISQLRGENDNVIFAGMMRVDHYDEATGRIYLDTDEGVLYNPFREGDILMVQRFGGIPSEENDYNVIKQYELQVKEAGVGDLADEEKRLDWITFTNFVGELSDIAEGDVLTRVDSITDSTRKGIVKVTTIDETGAPYIDVVYGMKTDPENATKARMGNLSGIRTKSGIDLTGLWGIYGNGAYFENSTYILQNGNTIEQEFSIMNGEFNSIIGQIKNDMSLEAGNILVNSTFSGNTNYWVVNNTGIHFFSFDGQFLLANGYFLSEKNNVADIFQDGGRNVLRLKNSGITQLNDVMEIPVHEETEEVEYTYSFSLYYKVITSGTLSVGIEGSELHVSQELSPTNEYLKLSHVGKWNEKGDFVISYTGEIYIYGVSLFNDALADAIIKLETGIQQTSEEIKLWATKEIEDAEGRITTKYDAELAITAEQISQRVTKEEFDSETGALERRLEGKITVQADRIDAVVSDIDYINNTIETAGWITTAQGNQLYASKTLENGNTIVSYINQTATTVSISASKINLNGAVTFNSFDNALKNQINSKVDQTSLTSTLANYVTKYYLTQELDDYALASDLSKYVNSTQLSNTLASYATKTYADSSAESEANTAMKKVTDALVKGQTTIIGGLISTNLIDVDTIYANQAKIGNFTISNGWLKCNANTSNDVGYIDMMGTNTRIAFGRDLIPETAGGAFTLTARIENNNTSTQLNGVTYGLEVTAKGNFSNRVTPVAINAKGGISSMGTCAFIEDLYETNVAVSAKRLRYNRTFIFQQDSDINAPLPNYSSIGNEFGYFTSGNGVIDHSAIIIYLLVTPFKNGRIYVTCDGGNNVNNIYDNNGNVLKEAGEKVGFWMGKGDAAILMYMNRNWYIISRSS